MILPGGLWHNGERQRDYAFKVLTGAVELALAEAAEGARSRPEAVTNALAASLQSLGHLEPTPDRIDALSIGDRQFLTQQLAVLQGLNEVWMSTVCRRCGESFDFLIRFSELPVKEAGPGFPFVQVTTSLGEACWRVPTGADQKVLASLLEGEDGPRGLVDRCLVAVSDLGEQADWAPWLADLSQEDVKHIEAALEEVAPEVTAEVQVSCIACGQNHRVEIDPYFGLYYKNKDITTEIHLIASNYHWSEADILSLSQGRRQRYLHLIDQSRGLMG